eukprot:101546-Chlamydomonas_euryale.AAC.1
MGCVLARPCPCRGQAGDAEKQQEHSIRFPPHPASNTVHTSSMRPRSPRGGLCDPASSASSDVDAASPLPPLPPPCVLLPPPPPRSARPLNGRARVGLLLLRVGSGVPASPPPVPLPEAGRHAPPTAPLCAPPFDSSAERSGVAQFSGGPGISVDERLDSCGSAEAASTEEARPTADASAPRPVQLGCAGSGGRGTAPETSRVAAAAAAASPPPATTASSGGALLK